jgi:K+-transporting ATPase ATPase C chain
MLRETKNALAACIVTFALSAVAYPGAVWALAQLALPHQAEGSLVLNRDRSVIGSELIAQPFASDRYFHPRPSAVAYRADAAGGSNLGSKNPDLRKQIAERSAAAQASREHPVPVDLVTASGSGLDPELSPEAAYYQAARVAAARGRDEEEVRSVVASLIDDSAALIGAPPRVNVLRLNLALDGRKKSSGTPERR